METPICANANGPERRRDPRMPYRTAARYRCDAVSGSGTIHNISSGGLFLATPLTFVNGTPIRIEFQLRNSRHPMNVRGEVVRSTPAGFGAIFIWT
jgi:hypothetical protein